MDKNSLIAWLSKIPGNPKIMLSSDAEGNSFAELDEPCEGFVAKYFEGGRTEEVWECKDLVDESDPDEAVLDGFNSVVVLYPI